jgi:hypothetical protein
MAPNNTTPVKKPRGVAAIKLALPKNPDTKIPEFTNEFASIEKELNYCKIGTFRVLFKDMTFEWKDGQNRAVASEAESALLRQSMAEGIFRTDLNNRMSGTVDKGLLEGHILPPTNVTTESTTISLEQVLVYNKDAQYPVIYISDTSSLKIEMQSGQHRMMILRQIKQKGGDHWWIVTLYDNSIILIEFN